MPQTFQQIWVPEAQGLIVMFKSYLIPWGCSVVGRAGIPTPSEARGRQGDGQPSKRRGPWRKVSLCGHATLVKFFVFSFFFLFFFCICTEQGNCYAIAPLMYSCTSSFLLRYVQRHSSAWLAFNFWCVAQALQSFLFLFFCLLYVYFIRKLSHVMNKKINCSYVVFKCLMSL